MLLAVDAGNTKTKWAVFDAQGQQTFYSACLNAELPLADFPPAGFTVSMAIIANVAGNAHQKVIERKLQQLTIAYQTVHASVTAAGVQNHYHSPNKLGADRWAAIIGAHHMVHGDCIVVNAGTAITVDAVQATTTGAVFLGGTISPGLMLMRQALQQNTARLQTEAGEYAMFPLNTEDAIYTGCIGAAIGLIQMQWQYLHERTKKTPILLLSGGDAAILAKCLPLYLRKQHIIVDNLVLLGLMHLGSTSSDLSQIG